MRDYEYEENALPNGEDTEREEVLDLTDEFAEITNEDDINEVTEDEEAREDEASENEASEESEEFYRLPNEPSSRNMIWSVVSVVLAVLSIPAAGIYWLGIAFAILSVGAGLFSRYRLGYFDKWSVFGLIFGIMGAVCGIFSMIVSLSGIFN